MLIRLITEERFKGFGYKKYKRIDQISYSWYDDEKICCVTNDSFRYFEIPGKGCFVFFDAIDRVYIPEESDITKEDIEQGELDISDWNLYRSPDQTRNPEYILNAYRKTYIHFESTLEDGNWILKNERTGEVLEFSAKNIKYSYNKFPSLYIIFPEKTAMPVNLELCYRKEGFIKNILKYGSRVEKTD